MLFVTMVHDVFGHPFKETTIDPACLAWNGGTIRKMANVIYEERDLPSGHLDKHRLAVLADMLEEADCSDVAALSHLRRPDPVNARGLSALADMLEAGGVRDADGLMKLRRPQAIHVRGCWALDLLLGKE